MLQHRTMKIAKIALTITVTIVFVRSYTNTATIVTISITHICINMNRFTGS